MRDHGLAALSTLSRVRTGIRPGTVQDNESRLSAMPSRPVTQLAVRTTAFVLGIDSRAPVLSRRVAAPGRWTRAE